MLSSAAYAQILSVVSFCPTDHLWLECLLVSDSTLSQLCSVGHVCLAVGWLPPTYLILICGSSQVEWDKIEDNLSLGIYLFYKPNVIG